MTDQLALAGSFPAQSSEALSNGNRVTSRFIDWIWHIKGSVELAPHQSSVEAFDKLDPLFHEPGTSYERTNDTLTFRKKDQAAQDKMSIFDGGVLWIERGVAGSLLHYRLASRTLLFCFLAPLLFLSFAGLTIVAAQLQPAEKAEKKDDKKDKILPQNPIDKFLGAPAPEKPKKDKKKDDDKKPKPTAGYVFAAIFAALYLVGRVLEDKLAKRLFKKRLTGAQI